MMSRIYKDQIDAVNVRWQPLQIERTVLKYLREIDRQREDQSVQEQVV